MRLMNGALLIIPVLAALVGCAGPSSSHAGPSGNLIGVVDPQRILNETEAGKKARESLNAYMKNRQALVEFEERELKRMEEDLVKQGSVLSANAKREREEQFRQRAMQFQQKVTELNREVQEKQKEVLESFRAQVEKISAKTAQKLGMQVVIEKGRGGPTIYADPGLDISDKIIEEFNKGGAER
jgi:outer membrane protein